MAALKNEVAIVEQILADDVEMEVEVNSESYDGFTPLQVAAKYGAAAALQLFLADKRVDANHKDNLGHTALLRAALQGHEEVVKLLLDDDKVDPNTEIAEG